MRVPVAGSVAGETPPQATLRTQDPVETEKIPPFFQCLIPLVLVVLQRGTRGTALKACRVRGTSTQQR